MVDGPVYQPTLALTIPLSRGPEVVGMWGRIPEPSPALDRQSDRTGEWTLTGRFPVNFVIMIAKPSSTSFGVLSNNSQQSRSGTLQFNHQSSWVRTPMYTVYVYSALLTAQASLPCTSSRTAQR
jgi:hypothetical protein